MQVFLFFDGGIATAKSSGLEFDIPRFGWSITNSENVIISSGSGRQDGLPKEERTNNVAEWLALINGMRAVSSLDGISRVIIHGDSALVINQLSGAWKVKAPHLVKYHKEALELLNTIKKYREVILAWKPREENKEADALSRLG